MVVLAWCPVIAVAAFIGGRPRESSFDRYDLAAAAGLVAAATAVDLARWPHRVRRCAPHRPALPDEWDHRAAWHGSAVWVPWASLIAALFPAGEQLGGIGGASRAVLGAVLGLGCLELGWRWSGRRRWVWNTGGLAYLSMFGSGRMSWRDSRVTSNAQREVIVSGIKIDESEPEGCAKGTATSPTAALNGRHRLPGRPARPSIEAGAPDTPDRRRAWTFTQSSLEREVQRARARANDETAPPPVPAQLPRPPFAVAGWVVLTVTCVWVLT
jgi:hypothetical protein